MILFCLICPSPMAIFAFRLYDPLTVGLWQPKTLSRAMKIVRGRERTLLTAKRLCRLLAPSQTSRDVRLKSEESPRRALTFAGVCRRRGQIGRPCRGARGVLAKTPVDKRSIPLIEIMFWKLINLRSERDNCVLSASRKLFRPAICRRRLAPASSPEGSMTVSLNTLARNLNDQRRDAPATNSINAHLT